MKAASSNMLVYWARPAWVKVLSANDFAASPRPRAPTPHDHGIAHEFRGRPGRAGGPGGHHGIGPAAAQGVAGRLPARRGAARLLPGLAAGRPAAGRGAGDGRAAVVPSRY